jgi:hypothetical protein
VIHGECEDCAKCRVVQNEEWCLQCDYYSCERGPDCRDANFSEGIPNDDL